MLENADRKDLSTIPELPEVESVRRSLEKKIIGHTIKSVIVHDDNGVSQQALNKMMKHLSKDEFMSRLIGMEITATSRRGKFLILDASKNNENYKIVIHLGMSGKLLALDTLDELDPTILKHMHFEMEMDNGLFFIYSDYRRFGSIGVFTLDEYEDKSKNGTILAMGPEPFDNDAEDIFLKNIKKKMYRMKKQPDGTRIKSPIVIKEAVLNQEVVAGVGNIYASECLWMSKILPDTPVAILSDDHLRTVFKNARDVMAFSITVGGSSINDYVDGEGKEGSMQNYLKAYGQSNCPDCGTQIIKTEIAGRGTFYCPNCQH